MSRLKIHPLCNLFPRMNTAEFVALKDDIEKRRGLVEPIWVKDGFVIDGRHRLLACRQLKIKLKDSDFREFCGDDIESFVVSMNSARRHLSAQARSSVVRKLLKLHSEKSDRAIAKEANVNHETVAAIRRKLVAGGELADSASSIGLDGKVRARKSTPADKSKRGDKDFGAEHVTTPADLVARRILSEFRKLKAGEMTSPRDYLDRFDVERERFANECNLTPILVNQ